MPRRPCPKAPRAARLKRAITPGLLLFFIVGDVLGGGIDALVGEVGGEIGGAIWAAFLLALVMAAFTAGSYAELVVEFPCAGGAGLYAHRAFKRPFLSFFVAFAVVVSGITSASALARGFGGDYLSMFVDVPVVLTALALLALIAAVNLRGIAESVRINVGFTLVEIGGLVLIVIIAAVALAGRVTPSPRGRSSSRRDTSIFAAALAGAALAFYALIGFEDSVNVAEETQSRTARYPKALFGGLLIAGVAVPARDDRRLDGRADRRSRRLQRPAAGGRQTGPARDPREALRGDRPARAVQRRADQHDHGLAAAVRDGARRASCRRRSRRFCRAAHAVVRDRVDDRAAALLVATGDLASLADTTVVLLVAASRL